MLPTEQSPLLNGNPQPRRSFYQSILTFVKAEGELSWLASYRWFIFGSWLNLLLLVVPVAAAAHYWHWDAPLRFASSFVAMIPLGKVRAGRSCQVKLFSRSRGPCQLLGDATEQMALSLGETLAGLLFAIVTLLPCAADWLYPVENPLGSGLFLPRRYVARHGGMTDVLLLHRSHIGGIYFHENEFQATAAQTLVLFPSHSFLVLTPLVYRGASVRIISWCL